MKEIRTTVIFTQSFVVEIMYNTYLRPIKRIPVRSKETILPGATLFVFLHPCFRCDRFLVRFLTSVLVKGSNSRCTLRTKTDFFNAMFYVAYIWLEKILYIHLQWHIYTDNYLLNFEIFLTQPSIDLTFIILNKSENWKYWNVPCVVFIKKVKWQLRSYFVKLLLYNTLYKFDI